MDEKDTTVAVDTETTTLGNPDGAAAADTAAQTETEKGNALHSLLKGLFSGRQSEDAQAEESTNPPTADTTKEKSYTAEEMTGAIEEAKAKWLEELAEAERVKKLSPEELAREEQQKKDVELETLRAQLLERDLKETAVAALDADKLPVGLASLLNYSSKEKMEESLKQTVDLFKESLNAALTERLRGKTPEGLGGAASAENMIKDQIAKNIRGGMI